MAPHVIMRAYLGLGANVGDRKRNLELALRWLAAHGEVVAVSALYRSPALVPKGAAPGPDFLNAACALETALTPHELLASVKEIERRIGRRPAPRWAARPIDIDILLYGEARIETAELVVPHPAMRERAFVLLPLADIAPDVAPPGWSQRVADAAVSIDAGGTERVEGAEWASR